MRQQAPAPAEREFISTGQVQAVAGIITIEKRQLPCILIVCVKEIEDDSRLKLYPARKENPLENWRCSDLQSVVTIQRPGVFAWLMSHTGDKERARWRAHGPLIAKRAWELRGSEVVVKGLATCCVSVDLYV